MNRLQKAQVKANRLLTKATRERDTMGYRENLGYDQYRVLQDYCTEIGLSYVETSILLKRFEKECDAL